jgi:hypothetical protein
LKHELAQHEGIFSRLRRLENAATPAERGKAAAQAIMAVRRRRLGAGCKPISFPPEIYADVARRQKASTAPASY